MKYKTIWHEFNDIFYDYKCHSGLSGSDPNKYSFTKKQYRYFIERITDTQYHLFIRHEETLKIIKYEFNTIESLKEKIKEVIKNGTI